MICILSRRRDGIFRFFILTLVKTVKDEDRSLFCLTSLNLYIFPKKGCDFLVPQYLYIFPKEGCDFLVPQ